MAPADDDLGALAEDGREAVLARISRDGRPQLSNVLYVVDSASRTVRISTTSPRSFLRR